jgi:hypothetical protein
VVSAVAGEASAVAVAGEAVVASADFGKAGIAGEGTLVNTSILATDPGYARNFGIGSPSPVHTSNGCFVDGQHNLP